MMQIILKKSIASKLLIFPLTFWLSALYVEKATATSLVSKESIQLQKNLTTITKLSNGIPLVIRSIPGSDIVHVNVNFGTGLKDLSSGRKALLEWYLSVASLAAKDFPKQKVFSITEKYGIQLNCGGGIEQSACTLGTLNEYWKEGLPLLAAIVKNPAINEADAKLVLDRIKASLRATPSNPNGYVNEIVNSIFYPKGHPYRLNHDEALNELASLTHRDLVAFQKEFVNASRMSIVVVSSMTEQQIKGDIERFFGNIKTHDTMNAKPLPPHFDLNNSYAFIDRDIPTAFVKIKMNAPSILDKDAVSTHLLYKILSDELGEEIRTKRSLSYAVHSFTIQYSLGIGVISVSTSKPQETFEALNTVIQNFKTRTYSESELTERKNVFTTGHFLTQETHASLAGALSNALFYYGDANRYYDMIKEIEAVTASDILRLANTLLINPRVGVIFNRKKFEDQWIKEFINKNRYTLPPTEEKKI